MPTQSIVGLTDYSRLEGTRFRRSNLQELTALIVGAGALGNEVVKALGLLGIGRMTVVDPDAVEASNLTRSVLFRTPEAIGENKAIAIAKAAEQLFPDTQSIGIPCEIADVGFQKIARANIIFSCADTDLARFETAFIATKLHIPVCDAGLGGYDYSHGRISYFRGGDSACYCCLLTDQRRRELLTLGESSIRSCWFLSDSQENQHYPSTPTMAAVVGALQVDFGLRRVLDSLETESKTDVLEISLEPVPKLQMLRVQRSKTCPLHQEKKPMVASPGSASQTTIVELLDSVCSNNSQATALFLDWPICSRARCTQCGFSWEPMRRVAWLRRVGVCPSCGCPRLAEEEIIRIVARDSRWANHTLGELGMPEHHLYSIEFDGNSE